MRTSTSVAYLEVMSRLGTGGTLEVRAAESKWEFRIFVLCRLGDTDSYLFNDTGDNTIYLW